MKIAELFVRLTADTSGLKGGLTGAQRELDKFGKSAGRVAGLVGAGLFTGMVKSTIDAQNEMAQLNAVLKSTGGAAGVTVDELNQMASELQRVTTFSDGAVKGAQALLLTFTQIKGAELHAATKATLNLAQAMGGDLKGAAIQVGKALNDPKLGLTALRKAGIQFTESQTEAIKKLVETGKIAEAQRVILAELEVQFGGSAEAARNTLGGALKALANSFDEALEVSGNSTSGITGAINSLANALPAIRSRIDAFFTWFNKAMIRSASLWQQLLANMRKGGLSLEAGIASSAQKSAIPAVREWGKRLEAQVHAEQDAIDGLIAALKLWEREQLAMFGGGGHSSANSGPIAGVNGLTTATNAATAAAQALRDAWVDIGSLDIMGAFGRQQDARREAAAAMRAPSAPVAGNFAAFAAVPQEFRAGQTATGGGAPTEGRTLGGAIGDEFKFTEIGQLAKSFAEFGPMAAVLPIIRSALEALAPVFESLMAPLKAIGQIVGEVLAPPLKLVADLIGVVLYPALKFLGAIARVVTVAISYFAEALGNVIKFIGKMIDSLPFVSAKGIIRMGQDMIDNAKAARKNTDATEKATEAVEKFAGALSNIPRVLNVNALRHMVTGGVGPPANGGRPWAPPERPTFSGDIHFNINGANDPQRVAEEVGRVIEGTRTRGGISRLQLAMA